MKDDKTDGITSVYQSQLGYQSLYSSVLNRHSNKSLECPVACTSNATGHQPRLFTTTVVKQRQLNILTLITRVSEISADF